MDINRLRGIAADDNIDVGNVTGEKFKFTPGEKYQVKAEHIRAGQSSKGTPSVSAHLRVVDGPDGINQTAWVDWYFSDSVPDGIVKRNLNFLAYLGLNSDDLFEVGFPEKQEDLPFVSAVVNFKAVQQKNSDFFNYYVDPIEAPEVEVPADDDDLGWDD